MGEGGSQGSRPRLALLCVTQAFFRFAYRWLTGLNLVRWTIWRICHGHEQPPWESKLTPEIETRTSRWQEGYVFLGFALWIVALTIFSLERWQSALGTIFMILAAFRLWEHFVIMVRDVVERPDQYHDSEGPVVRVAVVTRWMLMALVAVSEIVLCFAVIIRRYGNYFTNREGEGIADSATALYQSMLTLTTLGYGDFVPRSTAGRWIVFAELSFFVMLLMLKLPLAVSSMRMRQPRGHLRKGRKESKPL